MQQKDSKLERASPTRIKEARGVIRAKAGDERPVDIAAQSLSYLAFRQCTINLKLSLLCYGSQLTEREIVNSSLTFVSPLSFDSRLDMVSLLLGLVGFCLGQLLQPTSSNTKVHLEQQHVSKSRRHCMNNGRLTAVSLQTEITLSNVYLDGVDRVASRVSIVPNG